MPQPVEKKKSRSRNGCRRCKKLKIKCDETKPSCNACLKSQNQCDYSIKLTWGGRPFKNKKDDNLAFGTIVTFEKKYNPEEHERKKRKILKNSESSSPEAISSTAMGHNPSNASNFTVNSFNSDSSLQSLRPQDDQDDRSRISPKTHSLKPQDDQDDQDGQDVQSLISAKISPVDEEVLPVLTSGTVLTPQSPNTLPNQSITNIQEDFQNLQTSNSSIKQFVNEVLLPDLSSNLAFSTVNDLHSQETRDQELFLDEEADQLKEDGLDHLVVSENFHSYNHSIIQNSKQSDFGQNSREFTGFEFMIPELSPLPDMLLSNPYYKKHYNAYIDKFSKLLCPASPESYPENPFSVILPKMSLTAGTDGLLSVLLASSISANASMKNEAYPQEIVKKLLTKGLNDLYKRLTDEVEANSDYTLALVLLINDYELICGRRNSGWRAHFQGARKIMFAKGMLKYRDYSPNNNTRTIILEPGDEKDIRFFFVRWFAFLDIIGGLSSNSTLTALSHKEYKTKWKGQRPTFEDRENFKDIDPLMGFEIYFCEMFCEITTLVQEREFLFPDKSAVSPSLVQRGLELANRMTSYLEQSERERDHIYEEYILTGRPESKIKMKDYKILRATNRAFALAGVIQIYRRILLFDRTSRTVQDIVSTMTEILQVKIPQSTTAAYCTTLSLLSAGADAVEEEQRDFYLKRLRDVGSWVVFAKVAQEVMVESWETGKYWADILAAKGLDYIFV